MPHSKFPEQRLDEIYGELVQIKNQLPESASGDGKGPRSDLCTAINAVSKAQTDVKAWREFVDDSEVLDE